MSLLVEQVLPVLALVTAGLGFTTMSLWIAGRLAPWFLGESFSPPPVASYFFDLRAELEFGPQRAVVALIALALCLAMVISLILTARVLGLAA
jgi:hypothetical protein